MSGAAHRSPVSVRLAALGAAALRRLPPEAAHDLALRLLAARLGPAIATPSSSRLATDLAGLALPHPVGLAAGFDKNATALAGLARAGFGFLEVGAATPLPQPGNARPRLFRLAGDGAIINRFGFNNDGAAAIAARLARRPPGTVLGLNLGAGKDSADRAGDYARVLEACAEGIDFATINVSSPNTEGLRALQGAEALRVLLRRTLAIRDGLGRRLPLFVKIAPDLSEAEIEAIAKAARQAGIDGIVATNTTAARAGLKGAHAAETGGLSGRPLFRRSTAVLARLSRATGGALPVIGVGGVASAADASAKIGAGASAVQLYTGLVYGGLGLAAEIAWGLDRLCAEAGLANLAQMRGRDREAWLAEPI